VSTPHLNPERHLRSSGSWAHRGNLDGREQRDTFGTVQRIAGVSAVSQTVAYYDATFSDPVLNFADCAGLDVPGGVTFTGNLVMHTTETARSSRAPQLETAHVMWKVHARSPCPPVGCASTLYPPGRPFP
jgi:hypothetical protein